jgi:hypothetical protein
MTGPQDARKPKSAPVPVKLFGRRPHVGRPTPTGAGVRKAARDETTRWKLSASRRGQPLVFRAGGLSKMQRESCGMNIAKREVFTFCVANDFNDLSVVKRARTQRLRELLCWRPSILLSASANRDPEKLRKPRERFSPPGRLTYPARTSAIGGADWTRKSTIIVLMDGPAQCVAGGRVGSTPRRRRQEARASPAG